MKEFNLEDKYCYECETWQYDNFIERKYGEGTGLCHGEPKGCDRAACLCFVPKNDLEIGYEK